MYYSIEYPCGKNQIWAVSGRTVCEIHAYPTIEERHNAVVDYKPRDYQPYGKMECVKADHYEVRYAKRHESINYHTEE